MPDDGGLMEPTKELVAALLADSHVDPVKTVGSVHELSINLSDWAIVIRTLKDNGARDEDLAKSRVRCVYDIRNDKWCWQFICPAPEKMPDA